jgi:hypothetical protein
MNESIDYFEEFLNAIFEEQNQAVIAETKESVASEVVGVTLYSQRLVRCNVFLVYVDTKNEYFRYYYGMYVLDNEVRFNSPEAHIYCNRNAIGSMVYSIDDVKKAAKNYLNTIINQL